MATLQTGGFGRASVMPNPGLVDPRLLAPDFSGLVRGIGQGLDLTNSFAGARQLALDRADANALRDLRQRAATAQLELAPRLLQNQAIISDRNALEARSVPIVLDTSESVATRQRYGRPTSTFTESTSQEDLENGVLGTFEMTQNKLPGQDVVLQQESVVIDPVTGEQRPVRRVTRVLQTAEQTAAANAKFLQDRAEADERARIAKQNAEANRVRADAAMKAAGRTNAPALSPLGKKLSERAAAVAAGDTEAVAIYDADLNQDRDYKEAQRLAKTVLPSGNTLADYMLLTRNPDGTIRETGGFMGMFTDPVGLDPQSEALVTKYNTLIGGITGMATPTPAPGSAPTAAAATLPAESPVRQATEPTRPNVRQNGVLYRWDGTQYVPAQ